MSQFPPAFNFMMDNEDSQRLYACMPDIGGMAISGINSAVWPKAFTAIFAIPQAQRGPAINLFYQSNFWTPVQIGGINFQDLASRVFDEGVNGGTRTAVYLLQESVNLIGGKLALDGFLGPLSLEAVNAIDDERILALYRQARYNHYQAILEEHPEDEPYMKGWDVRALK